jgi:hypothetical protein
VLQIVSFFSFLLHIHTFFFFFFANMSNNFFSLSEKVAAISGCTRGIGKSMALALAEAGAGKFFSPVLP